MYSSSVQFIGSGTDDGTIAIYTWSSSIDGEFYNGTDTDFTYSGLSIGIHTLSLNVLDDLGAWSTDATTILIIHERPTAVIISIAPSSAPLSSLVHFTGSGTDDGTIARYVWTSSIDGEFYNGTDSEFDNASLSMGTHTIILRVQDNHGAWSEEVSTTLEVRESDGTDEGREDPEFPFNKVGPLPLVAYIVLLVIVIIGAIGFMKKGGKDDCDEPSGTNSTQSQQQPIAPQSNLQTASSQPIQQSTSPYHIQQPTPQQSTQQPTSQPTTPQSPSQHYPQQPTPQQSAQQPTSQPTTPPPPSQHDPQQQATTHWPCPSCGQPVENRFAFCLNCGAKKV